MKCRECQDAVGASCDNSNNSNNRGNKAKRWRLRRRKTGSGMDYRSYSSKFFRNQKESESERTTDNRYNNNSGSRSSWMKDESLNDT